MKKKVALVLGSGGARGMAHVGVIEELIGRGFEISSIAGTSMGAMVGGMYAAGTMLPFTERICSMTRTDFIHYIDLTINSSGFIKGDRIFNTIRKEFTGDQNIEDLPIPFKAVATDLNTKQLHIFDEGSLFTAIRASISIPDVFTPVDHNSMKLVDGAVLCPLPLQHIRRTQGDILVAVNLSGASNPDYSRRRTGKNKVSRNLKEKVANFFHFMKPELQLEYIETIGLTVELMQQEISRLTIECYRPDILIDIPFNTSTPWEFYRAAEMRNLGRKIAADTLDNYALQQSENSLKL